MKASKDALRDARQLFKLSLDEKGVLDEKRVKKILRNVIREKPRDYLGLLKAYKRLVRLEVEQSQALVESASELSENTTRLVTSNLKKHYGRDLDIDFKVNPDLIGGIRVRVGSDVWDGTVHSRIERLRQAFS